MNFHQKLVVYYILDYFGILFILDWFVGWFGLTALRDSISVYIGPSRKEREKEERKDRGEKMSKQPPPAPTASAIGPCPIIIQIVGRPGTGSLPKTIAPPDHPLFILDINSVLIEFILCDQRLLKGFVLRNILRD